MSARAIKPRVLAIDPGATCKSEPWTWPQTPPGGKGSRWIVRNSAGEIIGKGLPGNPISAWRDALRGLGA